jgi:hypothetical protein
MLPVMRHPIAPSSRLKAQARSMASTIWNHSAPQALSRPQPSQFRASPADYVFTMASYSRSGR